MARLILGRLSSAFVLAAVLLWPAAQASANGQIRLAVLSLQPVNIQAVGDDAEVLYSLISSLERAGAGKLDIMPRREMEELLNQARLSQGRDLKSALAAGQALSVQYVVYGQVEKRGAAIAAQIHLLNVATRRDAGSWTPSFNGYRSIRPGCAAIAEEAVQAMERAPATTAASAAAPGVKVSKFRAASVGDEVQLTWSFSRFDPIASFVVYRSGRSNGPFQQLGESLKNEFIDKTARRGAAYFYRLEARLRDGRTVQVEQLAHIKDVGEKTPSPPLVLEAQAGVRRASISFAPALENMHNGFDIKKYRLHRRLKGEGEFSTVDSARIGNNKNELAWAAVDAQELEDGRTYEYALTGVAKDGKESAYSDTIAVELPAAPELSVKMEGLLRKVVLAWAPVDGVKGFYLYRKTDGGSFRRIAAVPVGAATYTDVTDLDDGQTYQYVVTGYDEQAETARSGQVAARTKPKPPAPEGLNAASGMVKAVQLSWRPIDDPDVAGYYVYRGKEPERDRIAIVLGGQTSRYLDEGKPPFHLLNDGTEYVYTVSAYNTFKAEGASAGPAAARTKKRPEPVRGLRVQALGPDKIRISWEKNNEEDIAGYSIYHYRIKGIWTPAADTGPDADSYVETGMRPGVTYVYHIIARDKDGLESDPTEAGPVSTPGK
ncbi:MAG: fibronectin type III domain-containing protein [Desulfovibrionaceae bacterium]